MTVALDDGRVQLSPIAGTTILTYDFQIPADAGIRVIKLDSADVQSVLVLTTDYTVTGAGNPGGGTVVLVTSSATGDVYTLKRNVGEDRSTDFATKGDLLAKTLNSQLDRIVFGLSQLRSEIDNEILRLPEGDESPAPVMPTRALRLSNFFAWDASGNPIAAAGTSANLGPVSAFIDTLLDDADAGTARTTLGVVIGTDVPAFATVDLLGKKAVWVPAAAMQPSVTTGCSALTVVETTAGRPDLQVRDFDTAADEHAMYSIQMPKSWNELTVTYKAVWTHAGGQTAGLDGVAWFLQGLAVSDDESADQVYGTAVVVTDDQATAEDVFVTAESAAVTLAGTPASEDHAFFRVGRDVSDAADDLDIDARLLGIVLFITTNAGNDA